MQDGSIILTHIRAGHHVSVSIGSDVTHGARGADRQKFSRDVILIMQVPSRPSPLNAISMPRVLRNACDLRNRAASARGFFGRSGIFSARVSPPKTVAFCSSYAVPTHLV
jgi:hypothetical protein